MKDLIDLNIPAEQFRREFNQLHQVNEEVVRSLKTDLKFFNLSSFMICLV